VDTPVYAKLYSPHIEAPKERNVPLSFKEEKIHNYLGKVRDMKLRMNSLLLLLRNMKAKEIKLVERKKTLALR